MKAKRDGVEEPIRLFANQAQWTAWLDKNHEKSEGVEIREFVEILERTERIHEPRKSWRAAK